MKMDIITVLLILSITSIVSVSALQIDGFSDELTTKTSIFDGNQTYFIKAFSNATLNNSSIWVTGFSLDTISGVESVTLENGGFENNSFYGWDVMGDPNNCASDTICSVNWCNIIGDPGCGVNSMSINLTDDTIFGSNGVMLKHFSNESYTYLHSKVDLRRNLSLPSDVSTLSLYTKTYSENIGVNTAAYDYYIIVDDGSENVIWSLEDTSSDVNEISDWSLLNLSLGDYSGQNVTLIFRFMQDFCCGDGKQWDVIWSGTSIWYIDEIKIVETNTTQYSQKYPLNPFLDVGNDGSVEWSYSGNLNSSVKITGLEESIENYTLTCSTDESNDCAIPMVFGVEDVGGITLSNLSFSGVDLQSPKIVNITFNQSILQGISQYFSVKAQDNYKISSIVMTVINPDNTTQDVTLSHSTGTQWDGTWSIQHTNSLGSTHDVYFNVTDSYGNSVIVNESYMVISDNQTPQISDILYNNTLMYGNDSSFTFSKMLDFNVTDNAGLKTNIMRIEYPNGTIVTLNPEYCTDGNCRWSMSINVSSMNDFPSGEISFHINATDLNDNWAKSQDYTFTIIEETQTQSTSQSSSGSSRSSGSSSSGGSSVTSSQLTSTTDDKPTISQQNTKSSDRSRTQVTISNVNKNEEITIETNENDNPVKRIKLKFKDDEDDAKVEVIHHTKRPEIVEETSPIYGYIEITSEKTIENAKIQFEIEESWLSEQDSDSENVIVIRYSNGVKEELSVKEIGRSGSKILFETETPGFSVFVITLNIPQEMPNVPITGLQITEPKSSNVSILPGVLGILAIVSIVVWKGKMPQKTKKESSKHTFSDTRLIISDIIKSPRNYVGKNVTIDSCKIVYLKNTEMGHLHALIDNDDEMIGFSKEKQEGNGSVKGKVIITETGRPFIEF